VRLNSAHANHLWKSSGDDLSSLLSDLAPNQEGCRAEGFAASGCYHDMGTPTFWDEKVKTPNHPAMKYRQFRVAAGCELLPYLISPPSGLSRKQAKELLRFGAVTVEGKADVRHDTRLMAGDLVTIARGHTRAAGPELHGLSIVHMDDAIVVVNKPAGLLSMGSEREKGRTAHRILNEHLKVVANSKAQQAFIVHRLDRDTSGLMMFARSAMIQAVLQGNWTAVTKKYCAVVEGQPSNPRGTLTNNLIETRSMMVRRVDKGGEVAITHYRVLASHAHRSLLELTLATGRKHQIRVQLAGLGHPIVGDRRYGAKTDPVQRLALHSCALSFHHPVSGKAIELRSALPGSLKVLMEGRRGGPPIHRAT
jgi:23S rRNA pseudouridine1911/1915/1917 synthase